MADLFKDIAAFVDAGHAAQVEFLREVVKVPTDNPPGDTAAHAVRTAELLEKLGFKVERHPVPADAVKAVGMISATNLIVRQSFGAGGPTIALNAHGDVVPPGQGWTKDPYGGEVVNGALYGRGAAVSKSDFATYTWALMALQDAAKKGAKLSGTLELHLTYDEESGGEIGPKWLLERKLSKPDLALSAGFSYAVTTAHNGCLHLEVTTRGKQGHAAMPHTGVDALQAATGILSRLYALREGYKATKSKTTGIESPTLNVGLIKGGINTNVVPDLVSFRIDRRMIPEEAPAEVEKTLRAEIEKAAKDFAGVTVEIRRILLAEPLKELAGGKRFVELLCANAKDVFGVEVKPHGVPLYTDARHYSAAGVPTVLYGAGPRSILEANAHGADEHVQLSDLKGATVVVARTLAQLMGG